MQRVVFVNLHSDWMLLKTASVYLWKFSAAVKHGYLLNYLLDNPDYEVCNYINDRGFSSLRTDNELLMKFLNLFRFWENKYTLRYNRIDASKVTVIKDIKDIRSDDIVILYNICSDNYHGMEKVNAFKVLSMLHFHGRKTENELIEKAGISCFVNEVDLSKSSVLFRKYYHVDKPWIVIPFVFADRFKNLKPFNERQDKCFSTGTITYKEHEEFLSVYKNSCDQPARKFVKDNPEFFKNTVDCYSSDYLEDNVGKTYISGEFPLVRLYKKVYNRLHVGKQKKYFSFNMVEKFNDYKMHFLGEEILGVPGIGFVEGMACGSAYIGLDSPMYRDYGLIPGVHYIAYDGTKEGLRATVEHYQKPENQAELECIAKAGCEFVRENFSGCVVAKNLMDRLKLEQQKWLKDNK